MASDLAKKKASAEKAEEQRMSEVASIDVEKKAADAEQKSKELERIIASETTEEKIKRLAETSEKSADATSFTGCEIIKNPDFEKYAVIVRLRMNEGTANYPRLLQTDAINLARACCSAVPQIEDFTVTFHSDVTDGLGNSSEAMLVSCATKEGVLEKVEWANGKMVRFTALFETIYCIPFMRKEWKNVDPPAMN